MAKTIRQDSSAPNAPLLRVEALKVFFHGDQHIAKAVDGVSFEVRKKETVCLVGESGCGKSVSALSILGLVPTPPGEIAEGAIQFNGMALLNCSEETLQRIRGDQIAMIFQEPLSSLNPVFTIGAQIQEAIDIHQAPGPKASLAKTIALLTDVGIASPAERVNDYPHQLSGGQRQRVMIAMALACDPALIIADEPTTALDVTVQAQILALLQKIKKERGMSILYITHDLGVVGDIADRVYVMYSGVIVEQGTVAQLFQTPRHPYTQGLLASLPTRAKRGKRLYSIPGAVPDPAHKPTGCPFHPRCPEAIENCRNAFPEMCDYGNDHSARCPVLYNRMKVTA
ncbi:MAG: ABC transporter ATP-binding protein [Desulfobacterales bacterium]|jgi:oligopeptide/dipeptide ABC transporter ATP-binding protein|nr:ABC transporter ATP-binding protein [Desulfobacterales bacterium]